MKKERTFVAKPVVLCDPSRFELGAFMTAQAEQSHATAPIQPSGRGLSDR